VISFFSLSSLPFSFVLRLIYICKSFHAPEKNENIMLIQKSFSIVNFTLIIINSSTIRKCFNSAYIERNILDAFYLC
jgi:hypothetical protein